MAQPDWIDLYLQEDLDVAGDITSDPLFDEGQRGTARLVLREPGMVAGVAAATDVFSRCGVVTTGHMKDGSWVETGAAVMAVEGPVRGILRAERLALNLVGRMSGIATQTNRLVQRLAKECAGAMVAGTRKTTPGFRVFEKEAIRIGGGDPHRMGLYDEAMIKDNHREAAGDVATAVRRIREAHPDTTITAEIETLEDALAVAAAGADWILIDNQPADTGRAWAEAVWDAHPDIKIEASGGIGFDDLVAYGWADRISLGALTHQATSLDVGLDWGVA